MIYSAASRSQLAQSRLIANASLPERQLSTRSFPFEIDATAPLAGDSRVEEPQARLPDNRVGNIDLEQVGNIDLEQVGNIDLEQVGNIDLEQHDLELAAHIVTRIELRLPGRIRHLTVFTTENAVVLSGECSTFYTKQVAQHAAMGVLEYEQLINNIDVRSTK
jgi:uncharacterized protein YgbK (DUF1537 family)